MNTLLMVTSVMQSPKAFKISESIYKMKIKKWKSKMKKIPKAEFKKTQKKILCSKEAKFQCSTKNKKTNKLIFTTHTAQISLTDYLLKKLISLIMLGIPLTSNILWTKFNQFIAFFHLIWLKIIKESFNSYGKLKEFNK